MKKQSRKRVLAVLNMSSVAGQQKLSGIFRYLNERYGATRPWDLAIIRNRAEFTRERFAEARAAGMDGFILSLPGVEETVTLLKDDKTPVVVMDVPPPRGRTVNLTVIRNDARDAGRLAAEDLLRQGTFRSYGFVHASPLTSWSRERESAYRQTLRDHGFLCESFGTGGETRTLEDFLRARRRPAGIFAANDDVAYGVVDCCHRIGLHIPGDIAVIGTDNDTLICENCHPSLTSVSPDYRCAGHLAAETLDGMMRARRTAEKPHTLFVPVTEVVRRESTTRLSQAGLLVQRALAFIGTNALKGIGVADVVRHLRVSRRLADLRFRQLQGRTMLAAITEIRLAKVRELLETTEMSTEEIADRCGYANVNYLRNLFKRTFSVSMHAYRHLRRQAMECPDIR